MDVRRLLVVPRQVLGRRRSDGSSLISVSEMRDGIITFEDEADAQRYGALLEAEGHLEVRLTSWPSAISVSLLQNTDGCSRCNEKPCSGKWLEHGSLKGSASPGLKDLHL